uniref:General transcription factor 3C polypeptide 5 n=1 Tax=Acrobeloides nanus TaxID=290746 RepID=A0A914EN94_9BILA
MELNEGKNFVLIEYPGIIRNVEKALETLGGLTNISSSYASGRALELKYRPDNLYHNGLQAERKNLTDVVSGKLHLAIKIRRRKSSVTIQQATCLGMVSSIYSFKNMSDFQYLPLRRHNDFFEDLVPKLVPNDLASALSWWDRFEEEPNSIPNFLPPYLFSRYNTPSTKMLCTEMDRNMDLTKSSGHGKNLRVERKALTVTVLAKDPFPEAPTEEAVNDVNIRCKNEEPHRLLYALFHERPMWTRAAITLKTGLEENLLKILLAKFAFYISSGPWGRLWCRFGYDPRIEPESLQYQTVMVTFRQHQSIPERQRLKVSGNDRGAAPVLTNKEAPYIDFAYKSGQLPAVRQMWYCICDINLPEAQKILKQEFILTAKKYDDVHGWLPPDAISEIRKAIKNDVSKVSSMIENESMEASTIEDSYTRSPVNSEDDWDQ